MRMSEVPKVPQPEWLKRMTEKELKKLNDKLFEGLEKCE